MTAVIVAHDGATWLPQVADAILGQTRPVQRVVAVDTGSRDRSGSVLGTKFGRTAAFGMDRATGYGVAIARALQHRTANTAVPSAPGAMPTERIEWLWLLHDDCEPAPDCLEQLLRGTVETTSAAVLGPKLRDWASRDVIVEAGVTLDTATRRVTGIEPREVDQGQHDGDRDVLAVSSAGMLVRRDVWEHVGGFDRGMGLFMEDIDFCWRVHAAGYRVRVITDAIAYHAQAAARHRRAVSVGRRARMLDRRNGLLALLGNLPLRPMLKAAVGNVLVSLLRITFFLLAKRLAAAVDEFSAIVSVLCHPLRLIRMRGQRSRGRRAAYSRVRADLPSGRSGRRMVEFLMSALSKSQLDTSGAHHASADPTEDDSMLVDNGLGRRLLTSPSLFTFVVLLAVALIAGRSLIGSGPLGGGSLVPAWGGASELWHSYVQSFHPAGIGSAAQAPPWLALIAALATLLAGKSWLAVDVLMIGCVPLAGMSAMFAVRKVTAAPAVRVWASLTYALLPVATGIVASGRFGSAVAFILLPLILAQAARMVAGSGARATRSAWATGLLVAIGTAFVPLLWVVTFTACALAAIVFRATRAGLLRNLAVAALTPLVLLLPWSLTLLSHPADLLLEAGLPQAASAGRLPARQLMLLSPGGPGLPAYWITGGLVIAALAALLAGRQRRLVTAGWGIAVSGLLLAVAASHLTVRSGAGTTGVWPGLALALAALGMLLAAAAGAGALGRMLAGVKWWRATLSGRAPWAVLLAAVACSTPLLAGLAWLSSGVRGPIHQVTKPVVPQLVTVAAGQGNQVRTLVLTSAGGQVSYLLLRGPSPSLADMALNPPAAAQRALSGAVSALIAPGGGQAVDQARLLAHFDIGYVLLQAPVNRQLANVLNNVSGLQPYSTTPAFSLWKLDATPARVTLIEPNGTAVVIPSGPVGVLAARAPAAGGTLMLAEPAGGWTASLNGHRLAGVPSPAGSWAQAFRLPAGGGKLSLRYSGSTRDLLLVVELLAFVVVAGLALPGIHVAEQEAAAARQAKDAETAASLPDESGDAEAEVVAGGRRASRAGAAAAAGALQARSQRLARSARGRASRSRAAASDRAGRRGRAASDAADAPTAPRPRAAPPRETRLADAWPYAGQGDAPAQSRPREAQLADAWPYAGQGEEPGEARPGEPRLADAWPYSSAEPRDPARGDATRSQPRRHRAGADTADTGPRHGRLGGRPGQARSYSDELEPDLGSRQEFSPTQIPAEPYDDGYADPAAGRRAPAAGRSPSVRSASGEWPYPDLDAGAPGDRSAAARSPSGRSPSGAWPHLDDGGLASAGRDRPSLDRPALDRPTQDRPAQDRPAWDDEQGARAYRPSAQARPAAPRNQYSEPGRDYGAAGPERQDWESARGRGDREAAGPRRVRRGSWRPASRGSRAASRDAAADLPQAWPGGNEALEPLPPINGPGRAHGGRSAWQPAEDTGEWGGRGDDEWPERRWSAPAAERDRDYEHEHDGDGW